MSPRHTGSPARIPASPGLTGEDDPLSAFLAEADSSLSLTAAIQPQPTVRDALAPPPAIDDQFVSVLSAIQSLQRLLEVRTQITCAWLAAWLMMVR